MIKWRNTNNHTNQQANVHYESDSQLFYENSKSCVVNFAFLRGTTKNQEFFLNQSKF